MKPTQEQIIAWAEEAGVHEGGKDNWVAGNRWETALALAYESGAAAEREACASEVAAVCGYGDSEDFAELIRVRGNT